MFKFLAQIKIERFMEFLLRYMCHREGVAID